MSCPAWEINRSWGHTLVAERAHPGAGPARVLVAIVVYPFIESWVTGDKREHHILDRPRNAPTRTGLGVAGVIFYCVMWAAGWQRPLRHALPPVDQRHHLVRPRLFFVGPVLAFIVTKRICLGLQRSDRDKVLHGRESGIIEMSPEGAFTERHEQLDEYKRYRLVAFDSHDVIPAQPNAAGHVSGAEKRRGAISRFFFEDRVAPVTPAELAEAHAHHGPAAVEGGEKASIGS